MKYATISDGLASGDEIFTVGYNEYKRVNTPGVGYVRTNHRVAIGENLTASGDNSFVIGEGPFDFPYDNAHGVVRGLGHSFTLQYEGTNIETGAARDIYLTGTVDGRFDHTIFNGALLEIRYVATRTAGGTVAGKKTYEISADGVTFTELEDSTDVDTDIVPSNDSGLKMVVTVPAGTDNTVVAWATFYVVS